MSSSNTFKDKDQAGNDDARSTYNFIFKDLDGNEALKTKEIADYFVKTNDGKLLEHSSCISSNFAKIFFKEVNNTAWKLKPSMMVHNESSIIVAFKKEPKPTTATQEKSGGAICES